MILKPTYWPSSVNSYCLVVASARISRIMGLWVLALSILELNDLISNSLGQLFVCLDDH